MSDTPRTDALVAEGWSDGPWANKHRQLERELSEARAENVAILASHCVCEFDAHHSVVRECDEHKNIRAERDKLRQHAEAMATMYERKQSDSWARLADFWAGIANAVDAYRADFPRAIDAARKGEKL